MAVLFVFVDGVGVGLNSSENPVASEKLNAFSHFTRSNGIHQDCDDISIDGSLFKKIDANLGVEGLPQSGTGQTSLFSGENASKKIGKHFGPFPHSKIKPLLRKRSLFHKVKEIGLTPHFLNAYPDIFFEKSEKRNRWSCTTLMTKSAGVRLNRLEDVQSGKAITAEITQNAWREMLNLNVPNIEPEEAALRALKAIDQFDLVLYEYYLTDKAGHAQDRMMADKVLEVLDRFLMKIIREIKEKDTLIITSDHGNVEDLSIKTHTRNPVPLLVKGSTEQFKKVKSILGITPAIINLFNQEKEKC
ncbi:MAG: alkaline phosphatase family protein [Balneolaceae bacterium]|jgi:2,3-bisphosphoglycerate-independent phosphoglycerate mutase|nr:alkaline phosphatase family protein [Balneolaceae bacterium]